MKSRKIITVLIISIVIVFSWIQNAYASNSNEIDKLINDYKNETKCEHVSVVVFDKGEVTYYGDSGDLYQIGSMTKAFTGLAVQKLKTEGLIDEDADISNYIPGFEAYYDSARVDITVRNLLEQKSGYTNSEKDYPSADEGMKLSEWADSISGLELTSKPGTEYSYSNVNYNLLGLIIENVSGRTYRDYMEQEILVPLGLENTFVGTPTDSRIIEGTRLGYRRVYKYPMTVKEACIPAGYFYSNTEDMGRWIEIWTADGTEDVTEDGAEDRTKDRTEAGTNERVVPEEFEEPLSRVKENLKKEEDYYSGWELFADGVIGHSGGTPQFSSRIIFDERKQIGVCVLCNLNVAATTDSLCNNVFNVVSGKGSGKLVSDIWTIFDRIFISVTVIGILLFAVILVVKKRAVLIVIDVILLILLVLVLILFPIIFGAGLKEIIFIWAPWSLAGGLLIIAGDIVGAAIKLLMGLRHADYNKTDKG